MKIEKLEIKTMRDRSKRLEDLPIYPCNEEVVYKINELIDAFNSEKHLLDIRNEIICNEMVRMQKRIAELNDALSETENNRSEQMARMIERLYKLEEKKEEEEPQVLPCPFCGNTENLGNDFFCDGDCSIYCEDCKCRGPIKKTIPQSKTAWNLRK